MATLTNAEIGELLARAAEGEEAGSNRERAMRRAARAAFFWPVEATSLPAADRSLTELPSVGPWLARTIAGWLLDPSIPEVSRPWTRRRCPAWRWSWAHFTPSYERPRTRRSAI